MSSSISLVEMNAKLRERLPYLRETYYVDSLETFGSYVRGAQTAASDLDVLVTFTETPSLLEFVGLENYLSDLLGVRVDLVMKESLKPALEKMILAEAVPLS